MSLYLSRADQTIPIGALARTCYSEWWGSDEPGAILSRDRWRIETRVEGYNGAGGYWIRETWKWDRTGGVPRSLGAAESRDLERAYAESMRAAPAP